MRVILTVKHNPRNTSVVMKADYSSRDSVHERNIGDALAETLGDMLNFSKKDMGDKLALDLPKMGAVRDWICNSQNRSSAQEAMAAMKFVLEKLPHIRTKKDKKEIEDRIAKAIKRISW